MRYETNVRTDIHTRIVPSIPWRLSAVYPLEHYRLYVKFIDGLEGSVDLLKLVTSDHAGVFMILRDPQFFKSVYLNYGAVTWPGDLDLAPDAIYDAIQAHGEWVVSELC